MKLSFWYFVLQGEEDVEGNLRLIIRDATPADKGLYTARAVNSVGEAKCFSHVIVKSLTASLEPKDAPSDVVFEEKLKHPYFVERFADLVVGEGAPAKFECIVKGRPTPKVRRKIENRFGKLNARLR